MYGLLDLVCCDVIFKLDIVIFFFFFFQAEDGIRDLVRSRGLGDVYKRQPLMISTKNTNLTPTLQAARLMK